MKCQKIILIFKLKIIKIYILNSPVKQNVDLIHKKKFHSKKKYFIQVLEQFLNKKK
jgi:hypothetical protein